MRAFGGFKNTAEKELANRHLKEAASDYLKAWEAAPERYDAAISGIRTAVLGKDYSTAKTILVKLEETGPPAADLPAGLRNLPDVLGQVERLQSLDAKQKKIGGVKGKRPSSQSDKPKKSIADDFLSHIKK